MVEGAARSAPLRFVFFGTPEFAVPTLQALLDGPGQVLAVVTQPDRPRGRGQRLSDSPVKRLARDAGLPVLQPVKLGDETFLSRVRDLAPDLAVVAAYGRLLPQVLLDLPRLGFVNVHASLLPKYRGAAPVHRAVMAGETLTGVTIMRIVLALDAGPILAQRERPILEEETSLDVERDLALLGATLLLEVLCDLERGRLVEVPQDERLATYAPRLTKADGVVDWNTPAGVIRDQIRGLHPWPHAYGFLDDVRYLFHRSATDPHAHEKPVGTVLRAEGDTLTVAAGGGTTLRLLVVQPEGRRPMTARELVAGYRLREGVRFESAPGR